MRRLIADIIELPEDSIRPDALFMEDLGMDSMMALEILASIEKKFMIRISEQDLTKLTSLKEAAKLVREYLD